MNKQVLILGGRGRIGRSVAQDIRTHTGAEIVITGRSNRETREKTMAGHPFQFLPLDLDDRTGLREAIQGCDLVVHCAGPFHYRDGRVLEICIEEGVNYLDVSDHRSYYQKAICYRKEAALAGVTAILNTGVFPGISNSMVRQGVEQFDRADRVHLSYVVAGSGGAGLTVMRTTFLGLRTAFQAWIDGKWQTVLPYSEREIVEFPKPYGKVGVYWFDVPEICTFPESFSVKTAIAKFGSIPNFYNYLTWITAHVFPSVWIESPQGIEFFSRASYWMTSVTDRFTGIGVAIRAAIAGEKEGRDAEYCSTMVHDSTAVAAGCGTGVVAELMLAGRIHQPGVYPVEQALPTDGFAAGMRRRGIEIRQQWLEHRS